MVDEFAMCPYYKREGHQTIHCEGIQAGCGLRLGFSDYRQWERYKKTRCRDRWMDCNLAKMLNRLYEYEPPGRGFRPQTVLGVRWKDRIVES